MPIFDQIINEKQSSVFINYQIRFKYGKHWSIGMEAGIGMAFDSFHEYTDKSRKFEDDNRGLAGHYNFSIGYRF